LANNKSAKKRIQIAERNRLENKSYKSAIRTLMKKFFISCTSYKNKPTDDGLNGLNLNLNEAFSKIDKAVKRGVLHKNNASNQKSRMSAALKKTVEVK
tara:strand:- start:648 stop:941 length:294 start_codon:yes stop_codon:yes gene_type:complete